MHMRFYLGKNILQKRLLEIEKIFTALVSRVIDYFEIALRIFIRISYFENIIM
jgi:hypothetical protein